MVCAYSWKNWLKIKVNYIKKSLEFGTYGVELESTGKTKSFWGESQNILRGLFYKVFIRLYLKCFPLGGKQTLTSQANHNMDKDEIKEN